MRAFSENQMFIFYRYWIERNTSILPKIDIMSGTPLDGDVFVQITSMDFGYMVINSLMFKKKSNILDSIIIITKYESHKVFILLFTVLF